MKPNYYTTLLTFMFASLRIGDSCIEIKNIKVERKLRKFQNLMIEILKPELHLLEILKLLVVLEKLQSRIMFLILANLERKTS